MPPKTISLPSAISLVITSMIGVGVFTSVGFQLLGLPSGFPIIMLWVVGGLVSLCGALCYAELVAMMPRSGGEYHILREAYHPMAGFLAGWVSMTAGFAAPIAGIAMVFGKYVSTLGLAVEPNTIAAVLIVLIAIIHLGTLRFIGGFLTTMTFLKVALIAAFIAGALVISGQQHGSLAPKAGDWRLIASPEFATSLVYVMFAYLGWNGAAYVAGEVRNAQRIIPLSFTLGILIVMALYIALNAVFLWRTPWDAMRGKEEAGLIAAQAVFGERGGWWMGALISFGIISTVAGFTWSGSRVSQRMGQDMAGLRPLSKVNGWGAPHIALAVQTVIALILLYSGTFDQVINYLMCLLQISAMLAVLAVVVMRWRRPDAERPFRTPLYPLPPVVFTAASLWILHFQSQKHPGLFLWSVVTLVIGAAIYHVAGTRERIERKEARGAPVDSTPAGGSEGDDDKM